MLKIRFFISVGIYGSICVIMPFLIHEPPTLYFIQAGALTLGYLIPCVITLNKKIKNALFIWIISGAAAVVLYDYARSVFGNNYKFMKDWQKTYAIGTLIFLALHLYARFIIELVYKQLIRKA
ncbi:MAG: hypothetical protein OEV66_04710 [Spirochaetia bacterium]|nr:hypothetical protein [Spirochaetia bacterium]